MLVTAAFLAVTITTILFIDDVSDFLSPIAALGTRIYLQTF